MLPLAAERRFVNGGSTVSGVLDLRRLERIVEEVQALTGSGQTAYTVAVLPRVDVAGRVGGEPVDATFAPALTFDVGDLRLQPSIEGSEGVGPFAPREPGTGTRAAPAELSLGAALALGRERAARLAARARGTAAPRWARARRGARPADADEHERIRTRYGHLLLPVSSRSGSWEHAIELAEIEALVRLAEHQGKLILHVVEGGDRSYVVEDGSTVYRYRVHAPEPVAAIAWPPAARDLRARR